MQDDGNLVLYGVTPIWSDKEGAAQTPAGNKVNVNSVVQSAATVLGVVLQLPRLTPSGCPDALRPPLWPIKCWLYCREFV